MSKIDYHALREVTETAMHDDWGYDLDVYHEKVTPSVVLELLDDREAKDKHIAELEANLVALEAENASFKDINAWCKTDAFSNMYREFKTAEAVGCCNIDCMHDAMVVAIMHAPEVPATDAFLAETERKAIRKFINSIEHILRDKLSPYDTEEMLEAMRIFLEEQGAKQ